MKTIPITVLYVTLGVFGLSGFYAQILLAWSNGPLAYRTGAPGDKGTCKESGCHNAYDLNSGSAVFSIKGPGVYTPGKTVKLKVSFKKSPGSLRGFEMTALDADGNNIGKFKNIGNTTQVIAPNDYRGLDAEDKGKYIEHTVVGNTKKNWQVKWVAPSSATGTVTFYAAGNDANGDGSPGGDYIYTTTMQLSDAGK